MKKKLIIAGLSLVVVAIIGFIGFKWYLNNHKAESEVAKSETQTTGELESTSSGVELNSFSHLSGVYKSIVSAPPTSEVLFVTTGTTATQGVFKELGVEASFNGSIQFALNVNIKASSIFTDEGTRDEHLNGDGFFKTATYPEITFTSTEIVKGDTSFIAKGNLNMLGTTKMIEIPFKYNGSAVGKENVEVFEGKLTINPTNHGLGDDGGEAVVISFYTELTKQND